MKPYSLIDKNILFDKTLSLEAKGVYGLLMSFDSSEIDIPEISKYASESKETITKCLNELQKHGYV